MSLIHKGDRREKAAPPFLRVGVQGPGGQGPLSLSLIHLLIWKSQHPEDKFPWRGITRSLSRCPQGCLGSRDRPGTVRCDKGKMVREEGVVEIWTIEPQSPLGCRQTARR